MASVAVVAFVAMALEEPSIVAVEPAVSFGSFAVGSCSVVPCSAFAAD